MLSKLVNRYGYGLLLLGAVLMVACGSGDTAEMELRSTAFEDGGQIPAQYSCDGADISPPLQWRNLPAETASLALIMDDPDTLRVAWVHWVLFNLPAGSSGLPEQISPAETVPGGGRQGNSSWNRIGYSGPCPPSGTHRYLFKLYALDRQLDLEPGATKTELLEAMEGHILGEAQLMGRYERS